MKTITTWVVAASAVLGAAGRGAAQQPSAAATALPIPAVGDMAPDFALRGATRFGLLRDPVRLSDYRGQTVVVWFFFKARTKG
jgi:hypothetical protein